MSLRQDTKWRGRVVRSITIDQLSYELDEDEEGLTEWGPVALVEPEVEVAGSEESPRFGPVWIIGWPKGYKGLPEAIGPGWRVEIAEWGIYELLSLPRQLREHNFQEGYTALAELVTRLYPIEATLYEKGSAIPDDEGQDIILAMWDEKDQQERASRYDNMDAECPIEFSVEVNHQIVINDRIWNVVDVRTNWVGPRQQFTLRSPVLGA